MLGSKQRSRGAPLRARSAQSRSRSRFHIHAAYKLTPKDSGSSSSSIRAFTIDEMTAATVGSDSGKCDIVLPAEEGVDAEHAKLEVEVEDEDDGGSTTDLSCLALSSTHGTYVDGKELSVGATRICRPGSEVCFGTDTATFTVSKE